MGGKLGVIYVSTGGVDCAEGGVRGTVLDLDSLGGGKKFLYHFCQGSVQDGCW